MCEQTRVELERLLYLREVGFPFAEQKRREGCLDFNVFSSDLGACRCLLGWIVDLPALQADGWEGPYPVWRDDPGGVAPRGAIPSSSAARYYGIPRHEAVRLFGVASFGSLGARARRLDRIIARKQEEVAS